MGTNAVQTGATSGVTVTKLIASAIISLEMAWLALAGIFVWANAGEPIFVDMQNVDTTAYDRRVAATCLAFAGIFAVCLLSAWLPPQRPLVKLSFWMTLAANFAMFALLL